MLRRIAFGIGSLFVIAALVICDWKGSLAWYEAIQYHCLPQWSGFRWECESRFPNRGKYPSRRSSIDLLQRLHRCVEWSGQKPDYHRDSRLSETTHTRIHPDRGRNTSRSVSATTTSIWNGHPLLTEDYSIWLNCRKKIIWVPFSFIHISHIFKYEETS